MGEILGKLAPILLDLLVAAARSASRDERREQAAEAAHQAIALTRAPGLRLECLERRSDARHAEAPSDRVPDRFRLGQAAGAVFAAGHRAFVGLHHLDPRLAQPGHVALRGGVLPHAHVHRRDCHDRLVGREDQRGREIVGDARRHLGEQVGGRRADHNQVGLAAQLDVPHFGFVLEVPQRGIDRLFGERGERHRGDELLPALGHNAGHRSARFADQPHQFARFVRCDAAADDEQDPQGPRKAVTGHGRSSPFPSASRATCARDGKDYAGETGMALCRPCSATVEGKTCGSC